MSDRRTLTSGASGVTVATMGGKVVKGRDIFFCGLKAAACAWGRMTHQRRRYPLRSDSRLVPVGNWIRMGFLSNERAEDRMGHLTIPKDFSRQRTSQKGKESVAERKKTEKIA